MKRTGIVFILLCGLLAAWLPTVSTACGPECGCASPSPASTVEDAGKAFTAAYPNTPVDRIKAADRDGRYVIHAGQNIFYFEPPNTIILGQIVQNGVNITTREHEEMVKEADKAIPAILKDLPLDKAVKIGRGRKTVIEVSDPDCPYCRKAHEWFDAGAAAKDVTRYVFFMPLPFHQDAPAKAKLILCSKDRAKAYQEVYGGKHDADFKTLPAGCDEKAAEALLQEHIAIAKKLGVQGTPNFFINGTRVNGADMAQVDSLLKTK